MDKFGKQMQHQQFHFVMDDEDIKDRHTNPDQAKARISKAASDALKAQGLEDWTPDNHYGSRDSFKPEGDSKTKVKVIIRRWV